MASIDASPGRLRPEAQLLLATAGGDALDERIRTLAAGPIDWAYFLQLTALERAEAIVSARLGRLQLSLPPEVSRSLKSMATRSDVRMVLLSHRLDQTLERLTGAGIGVMLLKGAALGKTTYGSLPRRPMLDLDLLIPREDLDRARDLVLTVGWTLGPLESETEFYRDHYHLPPFFDESGADFSLELHHGLFFRGHPFEFDSDLLWARAVPLGGNARVLVPSPTDMIIHLCLHFAWSHTMRAATWRTFRDLRTLAAQESTDWTDVVRQAGRSRGVSCCYWTLRLAREWAGAEVPDRVLEELRPPVPGWLIPILGRHFAEQWYPRGIACPSARLDWTLWQTAVRPGWSGHGKVRPWQRNERFKGARVFEPAPDDARTKVRRHVGQLGAYFRYFRQILATDD